MKVLILGGCGYIGSALHLKLSKKHEVTTVDLEWFGNFINPNNIRKDFNQLDANYLAKFDVVILVAANSSVPLCRNIYDTFNNNVTKFVDLVRNLRAQKFIYASSSCVYVESDKPSVETDPLFPMDGLTLTKTVIDNFMPQTDVEYYGLRFGSVNGWSPNMRMDLMINAMTTSGLKMREVNVFNGAAYRPLLSINDLCRAVERIIDTKQDLRGVYNVSAENPSILEIGTRVARHMKVPLIDRGNTKTYNFKISSKKFMDTFNFKFEDTVESMVDSITSKPINEKWQKREHL